MQYVACLTLHVLSTENSASDYEYTVYANAWLLHTEG